ncbi:regulatory protein RecX [Alistipes sp. ZOR0009]|uniref:regulatory protein RecX n=1 Tax=Alistipes sp. ZOR0009 TaxID=1339253 RepID=UPI000648973D|nr:regulatory protein RecX [Alistipes sp. ZOR0009]
MKREISAKDAYERLTRLCSSREICEYQALQKMFSWGVAEEDRASVLKHLVEERYIDNERYAVAFARDKFRFDRWGPQKIKSHLALKHISQEHVQLALKEVEIDKLPEAVVRELKRKSETTKHKNEYDLKMKLIAFGVRKGFDFDIVVRAVNQIVMK